MKITKKEPDGRALDGRLFEQIQPHGGITFANPAYTRMGDGYCQCLHIYALPNTLDTHWLNQIFTVTGCICSFDVATKNLAEAKRNINRSSARKVPAPMPPRITTTSMTPKNAKQSCSSSTTSWSAWAWVSPS